MRAPASLLPLPLRRALDSVAGRHLLLQLLAGLAALATAAVLLLAAQLALDRLMDFSRSVRLVILLIDAAVLGVILHRRVIRPWLRRWRAHDAAFAIQRRWPELGSSVISALQLADAPGGAPLLVDAHVRETAGIVPSLKLSLVVPARPAVRRLLTASLLCGVFAALAIWQWPLASVLLRRAALADIPLPTATIVVPETRDLRAPVGADVTLSAFAQGVLPRQGRLELALSGGTRRTVLVRPDAEDPARFSFVFENLGQSFTYRFYLGDGRSPAFDVTALPAPLLEAAEFIQEFPAYTGRAPIRQPAGPLTLFPGSTVRVTASSDRALSSAGIRFAGENPPGPVALNVDSSSNRSARGVFTVPADGLSGISIPLVSADGIAAAEATTYPVTLETDRAPTVRLDQPVAKSESVVPTARIAFRAVARDDFSLTRAELVIEIDGRQRRRPLDLGEAGRLGGELVPVSENPPIPEGVEFTWWIEVFDNNIATGPGVGMSERRRVSVVSFARKQQEMLSRLEETSRRMEDVARRQSQMRDALGEALRQPNAPAP